MRTTCFSPFCNVKIAGLTIRSRTSAWASAPSAWVQERCCTCIVSAAGDVLITSMMAAGDCAERSTRSGVTVKLLCAHARLVDECKSPAQQEVLSCMVPRTCRVAGVVHNGELLPLMFR